MAVLGLLCSACVDERFSSTLSSPIAVGATTRVGVQGDCPVLFPELCTNGARGIVSVQDPRAEGPFKAVMAEYPTQILVTALSPGKGKLRFIAVDEEGDRHSLEVELEAQELQRVVLTADCAHLPTLAVSLATHEAAAVVRGKTVFLGYYLRSETTLPLLGEFPTLPIEFDGLESVPSEKTFGAFTLGQAGTRASGQVRTTRGEPEAISLTFVGPEELESISIKQRGEHRVDYGPAQILASAMAQGLPLCVLPDADWELTASPASICSMERSRDVATAQAPSGLFNVYLRAVGTCQLTLRLPSRGLESHSTLTVIP
jgi:hypothetical protein